MEQDVITDHYAVKKLKPDLKIVSVLSMNKLNLDFAEQHKNM